MLYICLDCKEVHEDSKLVYKSYDEPREFWGMPCYEHFVEAYCPNCGSDELEKYYPDEEEENEAI